MSFRPDLIFCNRQAELFRGASLRWLGEVRVPKLRSYCGKHEMLQRTAKSRYCVRGHLTGTATLCSVSKLTASVSQPVCRVFPVSGQRVKISDIRNGPSKKDSSNCDQRSPGHRLDGGSLNVILVVRSATRQNNDQHSGLP
jgi:hypothetical protein